MMRAVMAGSGVKLAHLRATTPFTTLSDQALETAVGLADEVAVPAGYVLVYEGDWGDEVFVIADGTAAVIVDDERHSSLGPGAMFGANPPLRPPATGASVVATSPMRFFVFDADGFASFAADHPVILR
jgi:CRP-like cAMP-binding protein